MERIEAFEYPVSSVAEAVPLWDAEGVDMTADAAAEPLQSPSTSADDHRDALDEQIADELRRSFEAGRERGRLEGRQLEHEAQVAALAAAEEGHRLCTAKHIEQFAQERDRYLQAVEHEVVHLALAVAARILRREAQMDPLLLTGAVRVALGQLSDTTQARLRVPAAELALWKETITVLPNLTLKPVVEPDQNMRTGECMLETELGSVDLGIRGQLAEIERGFFDRAGRCTVAAESSDARSMQHGEVR